MSAPTPSASGDQPNPADRRRKRRAMLAGGLVLGVGATMTLAAWTDDEFAKGIFNTSTFGIEGSTDGTTWADHLPTPNTADTPESKAAIMTFTGGTAMSPDSTVYSRYAIRTTTNTKVDGTLSLSSVTNSGNPGLAALYDFTMTTIVSMTAPCQAGAGDPFVPSTKVSPPPSPIPNTKPLPNLSQNHAPVYICVGVHLTNDQAAVQNARTTSTADATITWKWTGTSNS